MAGRPRIDVRFLLLFLAACGGPMAAPDSGAPTDAGSRDAHVADAGSPPDAGPSDCPTADEFVGSAAWTIPLNATAGAVYCGTFNESRTLEQELASKAILRITPGAYRLPSTDEGAQPFFLPACVDLGPGRTAPRTTGQGTLAHTQSIYLDTTYHRNSIAMTLDHGAIAGILNVVQMGSALPSLTLDGATADPWGEQSSARFSLCPEGVPVDGCYTLDSIQFDSCTFENIAPGFHRVMLDGGDVTFELRIGQAPASTEPAAFVRANGTFGGVAFDQRDYFHLVYNPSHHHFERDFAVLFDEPIDGACGIEIVNLEPYNDYQPDQAFAVDCSLVHLHDITVVSHAWEPPL